MIDRYLFSSVPNKALSDVPAVALLGSRQAGNTSRAMFVGERFVQTEIADSIELDLESPGDMQKPTHPEAYLAQHADKLVILDGVQQMPALFQELLVSATGDLRRQSSETLPKCLTAIENIRVGL